MEEIAGRNGLAIFLRDMSTTVPPKKGDNLKKDDVCLFLDESDNWAYILEGPASS